MSPLGFNLGSFNRVICGGFVHQMKEVNIGLTIENNREGSVRGIA